MMDVSCLGDLHEQNEWCVDGMEKVEGKWMACEGKSSWKMNVV